VKPLNEKATSAFKRENSETRSEGEVLAVDEYKNVLTDCTPKPQLRQVLDFIVSGFRYACKAGPLCGEPMRSVKVNLLDVQLSENLEQRGPVEVMRGVGKAVFGSFLTAKPMLVEPVYKIVVTSSKELAGECSRIIGGRRGKISSFEQKGAFTVITGFIPVAESFGLSEELRSATSGRAFWQFIFDHWGKVPEKLERKVIADARKRKGLPAEIPQPKRFLEENP
jgi:elongation factor 2